MIELTVPTTYTDGFLDAVGRLNSDFAHTGDRVFEIYGSFQQGFFNSARPAKYLPRVSPEQFAAHVKKARLRGIGFNYLLNAPGYANYEYTHEGRSELAELLRFLVKCGVKSVTVAVPYLVDIISTTFPELEVVVSTIGYVDAIRGLTQFQEARGPAGGVERGGEP